MACSGLGGALKKFARKVQSGLPIVGLLSRLATDVGGIGDDEMVSFYYNHICVERLTFSMWS